MILTDDTFGPAGAGTQPGRAVLPLADAPAAERAAAVPFQTIGTPAPVLYAPGAAPAATPAPFAGKPACSTCGPRPAVAPVAAPAPVSRTAATTTQAADAPPWWVILALVLTLWQLTEAR